MDADESRVNKSTRISGRFPLPILLFWWGGGSMVGYRLRTIESALLWRRRRRRRETPKRKEEDGRTQQKKGSLMPHRLLLLLLFSIGHEIQRRGVVRNGIHRVFTVEAIGNVLCRCFGESLPTETHSGRGRKSEETKTDSSDRRTKKTGK